MKRLLLLSSLLLLLAGSACRPNRPENAIVTSMGCLELEHYGGWMQGDHAVIGDIIVRGDPDPDCASVAKVEYWVFADANGDEKPNANEILIHDVEKYVAHTTSAKIYETSKEAERGTGALRFLIRVTDSNTESFESAGPAPE